MPRGSSDAHYRGTRGILAIVQVSGRSGLCWRPESSIVLLIKNVKRCESMTCFGRSPWYIHMFGLESFPCIDINSLVHGNACGVLT